MDHNIIYLVGPMGSGKSTIGSLLAKRLGYTFADVDRRIEEQCGVSVSWIFDKEGTEGFRDRETAMLAELSSSKNIVISTGAGSILREENRNIIKASGYVIFLEASIDKQHERTLKDTRRPLLQRSSDRHAVLKDLYEERENLYRSVADFTVDSGIGTPLMVTQKILGALDNS